MKKDITRIFQIAVVFIGTIVGAGLASGKEITQFFTSYGLKSFFGIIFCGIFYVIMGTIICKIGIAYKLNSYSDVLKVISPNLLGKITGVITTIYLLCSASIILAGSGALINQFFGAPKIVGTLIMLVIASIFLLRDTDGLIEVNSFIVPALITTITLIFAFYCMFSKDMLSFDFVRNIEPKKNGIVLSTILYAGYNVLCCSGVLVPLSNEVKSSKVMIYGVGFGALGLTVLSCIINLLLFINQPYIYKYEIPLLLVAQRFGNVIQALLLVIIWLEMFSTEVSDIYSISKSLEQTFNIKFKRGIFIVLALALPISQIGFSNLISTLYPLFGVLSLIFIFQCIYFYLTHKKELDG